MLATVAMSLASGMGAMAFPLLAKTHIGFSPSRLGALGFAPSILYVVSAYLAGRVSERIGRRRSLTYALCILLAGYVLAIFCQYPVLFFFPVALTGMATGLYWPVLEAAMNDGQKPRQMKRAMVFFNTAWMGGLLCGFSLAGLLYQIAPDVPLVVACGLVVMVLVLLHRPGVLEIRSWGSDEAFEHADRIPAVKRSLFVLLSYIGNLGAYFFVGGFRQLMPEYAPGVTGWRYGLLVGSLTGGMLAANWVLAHWHGWHYSLRWFVGAQALLVIFVLVLIVVHGYSLLLFCTFVMGFPLGLLYFSSIFYGMEQSASLGAHSGNHESIIGLGAAIGPLLGGWAIAITGNTRAHLLLSVGVFAIAMAAQLFLVGRRLGLSRRGRRAVEGVIGLLLLGWLSSGQTASAADAAWWRPEWNCRRHVRIEPAAKQSSHVAWVRFSIPDQCHPEGADVRVVDAQGNPCRMSLLFYDPALYGVVAFEIPDNQNECWLYQGNPAVSAPAAAWEPQAGVFLMTARLNLEAAGNNRMQDMTQSLRKPSPSFGAGYRAQIYDGFNPFGEPNRFVGSYTAWLRIHAAGPIVFCAVSTGGSVIRIDGKDICRWRGSPRGNRIQPEQTATADLTEGVHKLEFHHFGWDGEQVAMVGWKKPADNAFQVIPADAFVSVRAGMAERLEKHDAPLAPDFECQEEEWLATPRYSYFLYSLSDTSGAGGKIADWKWTFSDGDTATGPTVEKMFFQRGDLPVTLTVRDAQGNSAEIKRPVRVLAIDKLERVTEETIQSRFVQFLRNRPLPDSADRQSFMAAAYLCATDGKAEEAATLYRRLLDRSIAGGKGQLDAEAMAQFLGLAIDGAVAKPEEAADYAARLVAALPANSLDKAALTIALGRLQLRQLARPGDALTTFQTALQCLPGNALRQTREREALIGTGDAQRAMAHAPEAEEAYRKAQALPPPAKAQDYDISSFALTAEATIRDKEFDEAQSVVDRWQEIYPLERLTGYASILQSRIYAGRGQRAPAIAELETFLGCAPQGVFAQMALEDLGALYEQAGDKEKARAAYDRILADFQDPLVRQRAEAKIQALGAVSTPAPTAGKSLGR